MADSLILTAPLLTVKLHRADVVEAHFTLTDADGAPYDLTGYYTRCEVYSSLAPEAESILDLETNDDDLADGIVHVTFTVPSTHPAHSYWRLWRAGNENNADRLHLLRGPLEVEGPGIVAD